MSVTQVQLYRVEVNNSSGVQNVYVVQGQTSQLGAIEAVFNNGLLPNDVTMIQCTLETDNLVS